MSRLDGHGRSILTAAAIGALMLFAIGPVDAATVNVQAVNYEFVPASRIVTVDDTVRWTFTGELHTVTAGIPGVPDVNGFDSGQRDGGSFQVKFDQPGTFPYFCQIHSEQMFGTITVKAATATATPRTTPRPTPTQRPTAKPTQRPTARPTTAPTETPTSAPSATPTALLTQSPAASDPPTASPTAASASPSAAIPQTPAPTPSPDPGGPASSSLDPLAVIAGALVIGLLVAGGFALARRSRRA